MAMTSVEDNTILLGATLTIPRVIAGISNHKPNNPKISKRGASAQKSVPTSHIAQIVVPSISAA